MNRSAFSFRRSGVAAFTLLELLVVIAIVCHRGGAAPAGLDRDPPAHRWHRCLHLESAADRHGPRQLSGRQRECLARHSFVQPIANLQQFRPHLHGPANLAQYLALPPATNIVQKAPVFICPAYARVVPALNYPVYGLETVFESRSPAGVTQPAVPVYPFGVTDGGTQPPMRLAALTGIADSSGKPISLAEVIVLRDYTVHTDHLNALAISAWHGPGEAGDDASDVSDRRVGASCLALKLPGSWRPPL